MRVIGATALGTVLALLAGAGTASAQTGYCEGTGGPAGAATDAEHSVVVGDPPLPRGVRSSQINVDGVRTRVQEAGPPEARDAVVFLHGHPGSARDWDRLVAASGRYARTIAFDFPGYGKSDKAVSEFQSVAGGARFLDGVLDRLGVRRVVLAVHDFGAIWGLTWAAVNPDRFLAGVLVNSGVYIGYVPHPQAWLWATPAAGEAWMAATTRTSFKEGIRAQAPKPMPEVFLDRMYDDFDRGTRCAALQYYRSGFEDPGRGRKLADALRPYDRRALVVWGEDDPYVPAEHAERQREAFPRAQVELIPDAGHWPFVDSPEHVHGLVAPFLKPVLSSHAPRVRPGRRAVQVTLRSTSFLPALRVRAHLRPLGRGGQRGPVVAKTRPRAVASIRRLRLRAARRLRPGRYELVVRARGLGARRHGLHVR